MASEIEVNYCPIIIIGAGMSGATAFFEISKFSPILLLEQKGNYIEKPYDASRIICGHTFQFFPKELDRNDSDIFFNYDIKVQYASKNNHVIVPFDNELEKKMGVIINEGNYNKKLLDLGVKNGGEIQWETEVTKIERNNVPNTPRFTIMCKYNERETSYFTDIIIIATGSFSIKLREELGFPLPRLLNTVCTTFYLPLEKINEGIPMDYLFLRHPQISNTGPFGFTKSHNFLNFFYVSDEKPEVMKEKMLRILKNYKPISSYFTYVENHPKNLTESDLKIKKVGKDPVSPLYKDGIFLIGESAGLVSEYYYEGALGAIASAQILSNTLEEANRSVDNEKKEQNYLLYEKNLQLKIMGNYQKCSKSNEELIYDAGKNQFDIWDAYIEMLKKDKKARKYIYDAWTKEDLYNYPLAHDLYCGEKIFLNLPLSKKLLLTPHFLKFKLRK